MNSARIFFGLALLAAVRVSSADALPIESGAARCDRVGDSVSQCEIRWDLSATPRAKYSVEWLNPNTGLWEPVFKRTFRSPHQSGGVVDAGKLYRVVACSRHANKQACVSTSAVWAPVILPVNQIPEAVSIASPSGEIDTAAISRGADLYTQLMQLNVYMLSDLLSRAVEAPLPPMRAPAEPGTPGDMRHDIHHNVYFTYESTRKGRMPRLAEESARLD